MSRWPALLLLLTACGPAFPDRDPGVPPRPDAGIGADGPDEMPSIPATVARADETCSNGRRVQVRRSIDGDTIETSLYTSAGYERVRLVGVDTPESIHEVECFGPEASAYTKSVLDGQQVCLTYDPAVTAQSDNIDAYGRTLGYVFFGERYERFFNAELVHHGYADDFPFTRGAVYGNFLRDLQRAAEADGRGMWGTCE